MALDLHMTNLKFAKRVYRLQNAIVRELNNDHIFLEQVRPVLNQVKRDYESSEWKGDRQYYVPSAKSGNFAKRTDVELQEIYNRNIQSGLYEAFLVSLVARFEWFLTELLSEYLLSYPRRITERFPGVPGIEKVDVRVVLESSDRGEILARTVAGYISNIFRQRPSVYMSYLSQLIGVNEDGSFQEFYEISATRDLIVHNSRIANELYVEKSGKEARASLGEEVSVDKEYFAHCVSGMKRLSGVIKRDIELKYGVNRGEV